MLVDKINNHHIQCNPYGKNQRCSALLEYSNDSFQRQPSFCSITNSAIDTGKSGAEILKKYFEKMRQFRQNSATFLYSEEKKLNFANMIVLDAPLKFTDAIDSFVENIRAYNKTLTKRPVCDISSIDLQAQKEIIKDIPYLANMQIKGIMGQGVYNTAYLTAENKVLKLSQLPNTPHPEDYVPTVESEIIEGFAAKVGTRRLFGLKENLTENSEIIELSPKIYGKTWKKLHKALKEFKKEFDFKFDFDKYNYLGTRQIGTQNNESRLIDHGSIDFRRYIDIKDAQELSQLNLNYYPVHFITTV